MIKLKLIVQGVKLIISIFLRVKFVRKGLIFHVNLGMHKNLLTIIQIIQYNIQLLMKHIYLVHHNNSA